jgi:AP-2 complex subunit alpha
MVKVGAYVLSEFGFLISEDPSKSMQKQFDLVMHHFHNLNTSSRGMLLTAFMKMQKHSPALKNQVVNVLE